MALLKPYCLISSFPLSSGSPEPMALCWPKAAIETVKSYGVRELITFYGMARVVLWPG